MELNDAMETQMSVNGIEYRVKKLLGKGKGGYSYLVENNGNEYVLKQIHHEPCEYYQFGNKIQSEIDDYNKLKSIGIRMPRLIDADIENERILKEYIEGKTADELVKEGTDVSEYIEQVRCMCTLLYDKHINIDYFPTNFVVREHKVYYIDFECNDYMEKWDFENWGIKYWRQSPELT